MSNGVPGQGVVVGQTEFPVPVERAADMYRGALPAGGGGTLLERRAGYEGMLARLPIPDDAVITAGTYGGVEGFWVQAAGVASGRVGVMFHGGGYIIGSAKGYRGYAAEVSRVTNARVFVAEYRLAPEHPFPAAIEDARGVLAAAMEEVGPSRVLRSVIPRAGGWCSARCGSCTARVGRCRRVSCSSLRWST